MLPLAFTAKEALVENSQEMIDFLLRVGWTKLEIANAIGTTPVTVLHWLRGEGRPRYEIFKTLRQLYLRVKRELEEVRG